MKAALTRAAETMALEFAPLGIRVNCVAPGAIAREANTERGNKLGMKIPLGRMGTPADIGNAVAWLCSDEASYITGITLRVDGGLILPGMPEDISPEAGYGWGIIHQ
jgi:NAD(P)-dependent dehydrogenase (short-subunit alcohol dehydrogenase family)